ncbi:cysteine hydrolase family protein [Streptomyces sp. NL15-2K]|uniref:cysteine hydrolase family protein n=1 Tax=Streptomyces sp. NL15-2K TaxID=376149 RepID=UPI000F58E3D0|nr:MULTISPECIES: isochorismatase family cysteine hydrolase [Actinomycetes]WKX08861.1 isochorismatase family cysteine hydrolase [Kutzneria buriramensis]GCB49649.1 nicotinamidase/isochorismatase family protein [Streptomyces sp. NL15-2K]
MSDLRDRQLAHLTRPGSRPALVVVDVQRDFADPDRLKDYGLTDAALSALDQAVTRIGDLVDAARAADVAVMWVELGSAPARPWRSGNWLRGGDYDAPMSPDEPCVLGKPGADWYRVQPAEGEPRVVKRGYSGFLDTDLDARLRGAGCRWLTVVGLTSECCVHATALDAMQLDWPVVVPRDATAAYDLDVNAAALVQMGLNVAVLSDTDEIVELWKKGVR